MNEKNAEYLENQLFFTGFGGIPKDELHKKLKEGISEFQLVHDTNFGSDKVRALLNFKMSEKIPGMYFFNSYDLLLKKEGKEETMQQNFRVFYGNSYTLKEGYNLMDGRSVNKNFIKLDKDDKTNRQEYNAWAYMDFKATDDRGNFEINKVYNYDLEKKLDEYPIKNLEFQQNKKQLMDSLKKGNRHSITLETSRGEEKMFIEASPRYNALNLFDEQLKPIRLSLKKEQVGEEQALGQGQKAGNDAPTPVDQAKWNKNGVGEKAADRSEKVAAGDEGATKTTNKKARTRGVS